MQLASLVTVPPRGDAPAPAPVRHVAAATAGAGDPRRGQTSYAGIDALRGVELLHRLGALASERHVPRTYFDAADELFLRADDTDGDDMVPDLYTGQLRGPVVASRQDAWDRKLSVEHTWPRSHGAKGIAEVDLHHLRSADSDGNGHRQSHPYGEVERATWSTPVGPAGEQSRLGADALGRTVFEPAESAKGDLARGLLYFYTRYASDPQEKHSVDNFRVELPNLLAWHAADPVTDAERARNDVVEAFQGNRNPYVDRPELVDLVGIDGFTPAAG